MKKTPLILSGFLLVLAAYIIHSFTSGSAPNFDFEIIKFFAGICFGTGVGLLIVVFFGKKTQKQIN